MLCPKMSANFTITFLHDCAIELVAVISIGTLIVACDEAFFAVSNIVIYIFFYWFLPLSWYFKTLILNDLSFAIFKLSSVSFVFNTLFSNSAQTSLKLCKLFFKVISASQYFFCLSQAFRRKSKQLLIIKILKA